MDDSLNIDPPLYLTGKKIQCWRCGARMPVVALLAPHVEDTENEVCVLTNISYLPGEILLFLRQRVPTYKLKYSKTDECKYYANTCPKCGVLSGDFFLHSEPGAPFFPEDAADAKNLYITEIPLSGRVSVHGLLSMGTSELILANAKRI